MPPFDLTISHLNTMHLTVHRVQRLEHFVRHYQASVLPNFHLATKDRPSTQTPKSIKLKLLKGSKNYGQKADQFVGRKKTSNVDQQPSASPTA
jgi:hypothetical protein